MQHHHTPTGSISNRACVGGTMYLLGVGMQYNAFVDAPCNSPDVVQSRNSITSHTITCYLYDTEHLYGVFKGIGRQPHRW